MNVKRVLPLTGIGAVLLIIVGFAAAGSTPREDAPVGKLVSFYNDHDTGQVVSGVLLSLGALLFLMFASAVVEVFRRADVESGVFTTLCHGGALLFVSGMTFGAGLSVFIGNAVGALEPAALQALHVASLIVIFPVTVGASGFLLGAGIEVLRTRAFPIWLGWLPSSWESSPPSRAMCSAARSTTSASYP